LTRWLNAWADSAKAYVEGENVAIEYRWDQNEIDRLPALVAEWVRKRVAVIVNAGYDPELGLSDRQGDPDKIGISVREDMRATGDQEMG
jgi:hypothetical protein